MVLETGGYPEVGLLRVVDVLEPEEDLDEPSGNKPPLPLLGGRLVVGVSCLGEGEEECVALVAGGGGVGFLLEPRFDGRLMVDGSTTGIGLGASFLIGLVAIAAGLLLRVADGLVFGGGATMGSSGLDLSIPFGVVTLLAENPPLRRSSNICRT